MVDKCLCYARHRSVLQATLAKHNRHLYKHIDDILKCMSVNEDLPPFIPFVDKCMSGDVKLCDPFTMHAKHEHFCDEVLPWREAISGVHTFTFSFTFTMLYLKITAWLADLFCRLHHVVNLVVSINATECLLTWFVFKMTCYVSSGTQNSIHSTHLLTY